jgi:restriction endonuclease Mrr
LGYIQPRTCAPPQIVHDHAETASTIRLKWASTIAEIRKQGIFFTTTSFSAGAIGASIKRGAIPVVLIDGNAIVQLMIERKLRVESNVMEIPAFAL